MVAGTQRSVAGGGWKLHSCIQKRISEVEPMIESELPDYPWQRVAVGLFEINGKHYFVVVAY